MQYCWLINYFLLLSLNSKKSIHWTFALRFMKSNYTVKKTTHFGILYNSQQRINSQTVKHLTPYTLRPAVWKNTALETEHNTGLRLCGRRWTGEQGTRNTLPRTVSPFRADTRDALNRTGRLAPYSRTTEFCQPLL